MALISIKCDVPVPAGVMALGEIGLTGEIMPVSHIGIRLKEAVKMKFNQFILPERNKKEVMDFFKDNHLDKAAQKTVFVRNLKEVMDVVK